MFMNGRILLRQHGGVRRYAHEVSERMASATVLMPGSAKHPWSARLWEQGTLARASRDGVLLSVAHSGPLRHPHHVIVIHDLLALTSPTGVRRSYSRWLQGVLPALAKRSRQIVTGSVGVADEVADLFGVTRTSIEVVYPGVSDIFRASDVNDARQSLGLDPGRPTVAALLDPTPRKNSHLVAALLRELQHERPDVQVVVAGNNRPPAFARHTSTRSIDRSGFVDLGAATDSELAAMYQSADVLVSLTASEGFGLPVAEAAACGAAVVTTPVPSAQECLGEACAIIDNPAAAKSAVLAVLDTPERRYEMGEQGKLATHDLRWGHTAASLEIIMQNSAQT